MANIPKHVGELPCMKGPYYCMRTWGQCRECRWYKPGYKEMGDIVFKDAREKRRLVLLEPQEPQEPEHG